MASESVIIEFGGGRVITLSSLSGDVYFCNSGKLVQLKTPLEYRDGNG